MTTIPRKALGAKLYGSIPHIPGSRLGPGDHHCHDGQARICTAKARDRHDTIIVQEKLDGSCVGVALLDGVLHPMGRAGWPAESSPYEQHKLFAQWAWNNEDRLRTVLRDGERLVGEWLAQAHGTRYDLSGAEPFVAFDIMIGQARFTQSAFMERVGDMFFTPKTLCVGPTPVERAMELLGPTGFHGALDPVEGIVYRVEREGRVDFLAKYVRQDKKDGVYLPEVSGGEAVWNWHPAKGVSR